MIRSRLRSPTSKSMMTVLYPRRASPVPMAALVVVLPTPPLPEVMTRIFGKMTFLTYLWIFGGAHKMLWPGAVAADRPGPVTALQATAYGCFRMGKQYLSKSCYLQAVPLKCDLRRRLPQRLPAQVLGDLVLTCHRDQFGLQRLTEDPCPGIFTHPGQGAAAQRTVDMDVAVGKQLRAGAHRCQYYQVSTRCIYLLPGPNRRGNDPGRGRLGGSLFRRRRVGGWLLGNSLRLRFRGFQRLVAAAPSRGQQHQARLLRQGAVILGATQGDRQQSMVAADAQQGYQAGDVQRVIEFFQADQYRGVLEEIRCLLDLFRQLNGEAFRCLAHQLHHGHGQHAALEMEDGVAVEQVEVRVGSHDGSIKHWVGTLI